MQKYQYITTDSILAKYHRDFRGIGINEGDAIEWIGEALGFIKMASASEETIIFAEVINHHADIPIGLHYIVQIARKNDWEKEPNSCNPEVIVPCLQQAIVDCVDCENEIISCAEPVCNENEPYQPHFGLAFPYQTWVRSGYYRKTWTPVRLANNSFYNSLVCKTPEHLEHLYDSCSSEYTIVEDKLRFSFKSGYVAIACLRQKMDEKGYPMIPDDEYAKAAITYYMVWKMKQREAYNHREGAAALSKDAETQWGSYIKKFKNKTKMPFGVDQYQNLLEQSYYMIPNHKKYYGFFGNLGRSENRPFMQR